MADLDSLNVRIITTLGHVDHGKTTLMDSLLAANNIISARMAGKMRYLDSREDEQERGITMESSAVSLKFHVMEKLEDGEKKPKTYLINMIDTPGHVDFSSEVSTASRLCDGALVLVDCVEGVCTQTIAVLRQAWKDRLSPILIINKFDRLITELKLSPMEGYQHLTRLIEQVNAVMGGFFANDRMEDDLRWREDRERRLEEKKEAFAVEAAATANETHDFQERDDEDIYFAPERGNVIFASALDGWGFRVGKFAQLYSAKLGFKEANLRRVLWGDFYLDPKTKKVINQRQLKGRALKPLFVQIVLDNLWAVYKAVVISPNPEKVTKIVDTLNLKIAARDINSKDTRSLLSQIFTQWLSLSTCVIQAVIDIVPAPCVAQATRVSNILYPDNYCETIKAKKKVEEDLYAAKDGPDACVIACVTKMFAVRGKDLPENKKQSLSGDEMRARAKLAKEGIQVGLSSVFHSSVDSKSVLTDDANAALAAEEVPDAKDEVLLGFARLFSGTLRVGAAVHAVLPKYRSSLSATHPHNQKYLLTVQIEGLYVMMGRELVPVQSVRAGRTFAVKGLQGKVWRSATLCAPNALGLVGAVEEDTDFFVNLASVSHTRPIVRVALEPVHPIDMPKLIHGLKILSQSDPCVETFQQQTGEHVILTAGELHLERCLKDLRERFAQIEIQASKPIVPFRESAVKTADMPSPKIAGAPRGTVRLSVAQDVASLAIRVVPLPKVIVDFMAKNINTMRKLQTQESRSVAGSNEILEGLVLEDSFTFEADDESIGSNLPIADFWAAFEKICQDKGGIWGNLVNRILAFGPNKAGTCLLVDQRSNDHVHSLRHSRSLENANEADTDSSFAFDSNIETGFQLATSQGPLCAEPMSGLAFFLEKFDIQKDALQKERDQNRLAHFTGTIITTTRDACKNGLLDWSPRLLLAMYTCDIQASTDVLGKVYGVISKRRGRVIAEEMKEGTSFFTVSALLPVAESFGFSDDIRTKTSGAASPQLIFSGFEMLDLDPFWVPSTEEELEDLGDKSDRVNIAKSYMDAVRERKGMFVDRKLVEHAEKQRTLKR